MSELLGSIAAVLDETVAGGEEALGACAPIAGMVRAADAERWRSLAEALNSLGFALDGANIPADWAGTLVNCGLAGVLAGCGTLAEAEATIHRLVSLDGEYVLARLPDAGESGVDARVLQFRLKTLGLFPYVVGEPWGVRDAPWEHILHGWLRRGLPVSALDLANLLGDARALWAAYLAAMEERPILILRGRADEDWPTEQLEDVASAWDLVNEPFAAEGYRDPAELEVEARNDFGLVLLRVSLWMNGLLSHAPSESVTGEDVAVLTQAFGALGYSRVEELRATLRRVGEDLWAVRLKGIESALIGLVLEPSERTEPSQKATSVVAALLVGPDRSEPDSAFLARVQDLILEPPVTQSAAPDGPVWGVVRRMYTGLKRAYDWTVRTLREGLDWLRQHVVLPVRAFVSRMVARMARGWHGFTDRVVPKVKAFFQGLHLTHDPPSHTFALTHMHVDADVETVISRGVPAGLVDAHRRSLLAFVRDIRTVLHILGQVVGLLIELAAGPIGWAKAAFRIGAIVVDAWRVVADQPA